MHQSTFKKKQIYLLLVQALSFGVLTSIHPAVAVATPLSLAGDMSSSPATDLAGSVYTKIDLAQDTLGARIYTSASYTLKQAAGDTSPIILALAGSSLKLNTSDISEKNNNAILKITGSGAQSAAIWIGREPPPNETHLKTSQPTIFQGQYLEITQKNGVAIDGNGSADALGNTALTTLELRDSKITARDGVRWDDDQTDSLLNFNDVSITADNTGVVIGSTTGSSTVINSNNLKITTKGSYVGTNPGVALSLGGAGIDATLHNTTISSKASAVSTSNSAVTHFTGNTSISVTDSTTAGGQNAILATHNATVTVDQLALDFKSRENSDFSGALSASNDAKIIVGQLGQAARSKAEIFNSTTRFQVEGVNAFLGGHVTLNSLDMVNFRKKTLGIGEDISEYVIGLKARYNSHITLNDSTVILKDVKDAPFQQVGSSIENKSSLTLAAGSRIQAGQFAVRMQDKSTLTMQDSSLEAGKAAIYAMATQHGTQQDTEIQATIHNSQITALQQKNADPLGVAMRVG